MPVAGCQDAEHCDDYGDGQSSLFARQEIAICHPDGRPIRLLVNPLAADTLPTGNLGAFVRRRWTNTATFLYVGTEVFTSLGEGGSIFPAGLITVYRSASQTFSLMAVDGYEIQELVINGQSHGVQGSCTFHDIDTDRTNFLNSI